ncbi:MAG: type II toxin-antitoxin system YafQ family toxin [bacterium]|nr:type II toxin-antitoxin system YafQ family toxin [bacterium]
MRHSIAKPQFDRDIQRLKQRGKNIEKLISMISIIEQGKRLPSSLRPHKLKGEYDGCWECHIESDWLLVWESYRDYILLIRTGNHADLFE